MRIGLIFVLTLILAISLLVVNWLSPFDSSVRPNAPGIEVMVSARDLPGGLVVQQSDFRIVLVSSKSISQQLPRKRSEVVGHKTIREIDKGELIRLSDVDPEATQPVRLGPPVGGKDREKHWKRS
jgi:flagella basal body P-ring formation protein FlgA